MYHGSKTLASVRPNYFKQIGQYLHKYGYKVVLDYCSISTLHGLNHLSTTGRHWLHSIFWTLIVAFSCCMSLIMAWSVFERYQVSPTMTTIESNYQSIRSIPFPAVTICNTNKILASSAMSMVEKLVRVGIDEEKAKNFLLDLPEIYTTRKFVLADQEEVLGGIQMLGYQLDTLLYELSQPCSRLLVRCMWLGDDYNCSTLFDPTVTNEGFCCSFNSKGIPKRTYYPNSEIRESEEEFYNKSLYFNKTIYVSEAGTPSAGLSVVINSELENYFSSVDSFFGAVIIIHNPLDFPDISTPRAYVQPRFETQFRLTASLIESSNNVRSLSLDRRNCLFSDEVQLDDEMPYDYELCNLQCKVEQFKFHCGCVPFYYPNTIARTCTINDLKCIRDHKAILASTRTGSKSFNFELNHSRSFCTCLPDCTGHDYTWMSLGNKIYNDTFASPLFQNDLDQKSLLSVFFADNVCMKYRRESLMTWDGLLAAFGGILGLCLGGSVISLIEIAYYFLTVLLTKEKPKKKTVNPEVSQKYNTRQLSMPTYSLPAVISIDRKPYL